MKQDTQNKLAAIYAAQQADAAKKNKVNNSKATGTEKKPEAKPLPQATTPAPLPVSPAEPPKPQPEINRQKVGLKSFTIVWNEGAEDFDGKTATTWKEATRLMNKIGLPSDRYPGTYNKVKVLIEWQDGTSAQPRIDIGTKDYNPAKWQTVGAYVEFCHSSILGRLFTPDVCNSLSFEDSPEALQQAEERTRIIAEETPKILADIASEASHRPELSQLTFADLLPETAQPDPTTPTNEESNTGLILVEYSPKSIAIFGATKIHKNELRKLGGKWQPFLKRNGEIDPSGWIFSRKNETKLRQLCEGKKP
jgi:hypothetical protein